MVVALIGLAAFGPMSACAPSPSTDEEAGSAMSEAEAHPATDGTPVEAGTQLADRPIFVTETWPEEGRPVFETTGRPLVLLAAPDRGSEVVDSVASPGEGLPVDFDSTRFQTLEPGRIAVASADTVRGRIFGDVDYLSREVYYRSDVPVETLDLSAGDTILYLQYRAEGTCFVEIDGSVIDADLCPTFRTESFEIVSEPRTAWWVRTTSATGEPGWILVGEAVRETGRTF